MKGPRSIIQAARRGSLFDLLADHREELTADQIWSIAKAAVYLIEDGSLSMRTKKSQQELLSEELDYEFDPL